MNDARLPTDNHNNLLFIFRSLFLFSDFFYGITDDIFAEHENTQTRNELIRILYLALKNYKKFGRENE